MVSRALDQHIANYVRRKKFVETRVKLTGMKYRKLLETSHVVRWRVELGS
jgi:hypothetical protein